MASNTTDALLNKICSCVERIEKGLGKKGGGGGVADTAKSASTGGFAASVRSLKGLGKEIKEISAGLTKFSLVGQMGSRAFIDFLWGLADATNQFDAKKTKAVSDLLPALGNNIGKIAKSMFLSAIPLKIAAKPVMESLNMIADALKGLGEKVGGSEKSINKALKVFERVSTAVKNLATGIAVFALVFVVSALALSSIGMGAVGGVVGVLGAIVGIALATMVFALLPVQMGARAVNNVGKGLLYLAGAVGMMAVIFIVASLALQSASGGALGKGGLAVFGAIAALGFALSLFCPPSPAYFGARALNMAGKGLLFMAGSIAIFTLILLLGNALGDVVDLPGVATGGIFIVVGIAAIAIGLALFGIGPVKKGAMALGAAGVGLISLSVAVLIMTFGLALGAKLLEVSPIEIGASLALILGGVAAMMWGMGKMSTSLAKGAGIMIIMAAGLVVMGIGLGKMFAALPRKDSGVDWEGIGALAAVIGMLGVEIGLLGNPFTAPFILAGSGLLAAIGLAMLPFSFGMKTYSEALMNGFDAKQFNSDFTSIIETFAKSLAHPMTLAMAATAAGSVEKIGYAMASLAKGIGTFALISAIPIIKGYDKNGMPIFSDKTANVKEAVENMKLLLAVDNSGNSIFTPFLLLAKELSPGGIKGLFSDKPSASDLEAGIKATTDIGLVLSSLAEGVGAFANLQNMHPIKGYDKNGKPIYDMSKTLNITEAVQNIRMLLQMEGETSILSPFIELANNLEDADDAAEAWDAAIKIGAMLNNLAMGVGAFMDMQNMHPISGYDEKGNPKYDMNKTLNITDAVANIRKLLTPTGPESLIEALMQLDEDDAEDITDALDELADGTEILLKIFNEHIGKIDTKKIDENVEKMTKAFDMFDENFSAPRRFGVLGGMLFYDALEDWADGMNAFFTAVPPYYIEMHTNSMVRLMDAEPTYSMLEEHTPKIAEAFERVVELGYKSYWIREAAWGIHTFVTFTPPWQIRMYINEMQRFASLEKSFNVFEIHVPRITMAMLNFSLVGRRYNDILNACRSIDVLVSTVERHFGDSTYTVASESSGFFGLFKRRSAVTYTRPDKWININKRINQLTRSMAFVAMLNKPLNATNKAFEKIINNIMKIPDTTLTILRDLTFALRDFTDEEHGENLIKAVIALQAALDTPLSESSDNEMREKAADTVTDAGVVTQAEERAADAEEKSKNQMMLEEIKAGFAQLTQTLTQTLKVEITNDSIKARIEEI